MRALLDLEQLRCRAEHLARRALDLPREIAERLEAHRAAHQDAADKMERLWRRLDAQVRRLATCEQTLMDHQRELDELRPLLRLVPYLLAEVEAERVRVGIIDSREEGSTQLGVAQNPAWKSAWARRMDALRKLEG